MTDQHQRQLEVLRTQRARNAELHEQRLAMMQEKHEARMRHMEELRPLRLAVAEKELREQREAELRKKQRAGDRQLAAITAVVDGDTDEARRLLGASPPPPPKPKWTEADHIEALGEYVQFLLDRYHSGAGVTFIEADGKPHDAS